MSISFTESRMPHLMPVIMLKFVWCWYGSQWGLSWFGGHWWILWKLSGRCSDVGSMSVSESLYSVKLSVYHVSSSSDNIPEWRYWYSICDEISIPRKSRGTWASMEVLPSSSLSKVIRSSYHWRSSRILKSLPSKIRWSCPSKRNIKSQRSCQEVASSISRPRTWRWFQLRLTKTVLATNMTQRK